MDLVTEFLIRHPEDHGHHFVVEIQYQVPNKDNAIPYLANPGSGYLACASDHIIDGSVLGRDSYSSINSDDGLEEFPIKGPLPQRDSRVVSVEDQLKKELVAIQVNGSSAQISSEYRNMIGFAEVKVYLLFHILMETNTDIRCGRGNQGKGLLS